MTRTRSQRLPAALLRRGRLAQIAILWERLSPILWPSLGFVGAYMAAASFGLGALAPYAGPVAAGLAAVAALVSAGHGARGFRFPTLQEGLRRLETDGGLVHRPYTSFDDRMAAGGSEAGAALWRRHQERRRAELPKTSPRPPFAALAKRDPYGLRLLTVFAVVAGAVTAGEEWPARVLTLQGGGFGLGRSPALNAWIDPPAYTGEPPIFLSRNGVPAGPDAVVAPVGSTLAVRLGGDRTKGALRIRAEDGRTDIPMTVDEAVGLSLDTKLDVAGRYEVRAGGRVAAWRIDLLPDAPPVAAFTERPGRNDRGELAFGYAADDDYGVEALDLVLTLADAPGAEPLSRPLGAGGGFLEAETALDFSDHPWAGLDVLAHLKAVDGAGQEGSSEAVEITLPARLFTDDLAKAAAHERRELVHTPDGLAPSAAAIDALVALPDRYFDHDAGVYLAIKSALNAVMRGEKADVERAQDFLWAAALMAEGDDVEAARRAVAAAQRELMEALADGASEQEIDDKLAELRETINRLMEALAKEALENFAQNGAEGAPGGPGGPDLNQDELQALLEELEKLAEEGARGAAQELLAQLRDLLENLEMQIAQGGGGQGGQEPSMFGEGLQELSDIIGRQRELLDDTYDNARRAEEEAESGGPGAEGGSEGAPGAGGEGGLGDGSETGEEGESGRGGDERGGEAPAGSGDPGGEDIAQLQRRLSERLRGLRDDFEGSEDEGARAALDEAERAMRRSEEALREGELGEALANQRNAIDNLREGAQRLAEEDLRNSEQFAEGLDGGRADPLGRAYGATGPSAGRGVGDIPGEGELGSARDILEALRERATDPNLPADERAYLLRLLDRFRR